MSLKSPNEVLPHANWALIPTHMHQGVANYLDRRIPPGSFMRLILENNFVEAAGRADLANQNSLFGWCVFLTNYVPSNAWGSPERVATYLNPDNSEE